VIVVAEEIVEESVIRADPNRTVIPGFIVDAVVHEPFGCHPSYAQGHYDRDNDFYVGWRDIGKERTSLERWLDEWVHGVAGRAEYALKMAERARALAAKDRFSPPVNYGY
jgi:glutaconate CoA-transferase subunit A